MAPPQALRVPATEHPKIHLADEELIPWAELRAILLAMKDAVKVDAYEDVREMLLSTVQGYQPSKGLVELIYEKRKLG